MIVYINDIKIRNSVVAPSVEFDCDYENLIIVIQNLLKWTCKFI